MTDEEWLTCNDSQKMLEFLRDRASDRKLRLFACACCRGMWDLLHDKRSRKAVECSELFADGKIDKEQLSAARKEAEEVWWRRALRNLGAPPDEERKDAYAAEAVMHAASATGRATKLFLKMELAASASLSAELPEQGLPSSQRKLQRCHLVRELFGNPFLPITVEPALLVWNGGSIPKLAKAVYDERDFDRLPNLADALAEAGYTDPDILSHLRGPGPHVRGCWAVDLILGKS
jgi:hypothetical protein